MTDLPETETTPPTDQAAELDRLRTENERMRHELEVMYGGAFDSLPASSPAPDGLADGTELTAEEARNLADELSTDLYRAQDALAFVGECCDIADREGRHVTTADVREWLKGARCGRQLLADATDRTDLRDRIRRAICEASGFEFDDDGIEPDEYGDHADAVLAVPAIRDTQAEVQQLREQVARVHAYLISVCAEPHPSHDHLCPDDVRRDILAELDQPQEEA